MKKNVVLLVLVLLLAFTGAVMAGEGDFRVKLAYDSGGKHILSDKEYDTDSGYSITGEYLIGEKDGLEYGVGITYQLARGIVDESDTIEFSFIPVYGMVKYDLEQLYLIGQLGYNLYQGTAEYTGGDTLQGGIYYGAGAGIELTERTFAEVLYSVNNGSIEDFTVKNTKVGIAVGVTF